MKPALLALLVLALLIGAAWWTRPATPPPAMGSAMAESLASASAVGADLQRPLQQTRPTGSRPTRSSAPPLPASLADLALDGNINLDGDGQVMADGDLRRLFDFLLTSLGEQDLGAVRLQLQAIALDSVGPLQAQRTLDLFERYLHYLQLADAIAPAGQDPASLSLALDRLMALRRDLLGPAMADGFFGRQEHYARLALERLRIEQDDALTVAEREVLLRDWEESLPPQVRDQRSQATAHQEVMAENRILDELQVAPAERYRLRARQYGPEAADRLAALDASRQAWQARAEGYFESRAQIESSRLGAAEREAALAELESQFSEPELRRLWALERVHSADPSP